MVDLPRCAGAPVSFGGTPTSFGGAPTAVPTSLVSAPRTMIPNLNKVAIALFDDINDAKKRWKGGMKITMSNGPHLHSAVKPVTFTWRDVVVSLTGRPSSGSALQQ